MSASLSINSTLVRNSISLAAVRTGFRLGSTVVPHATADIAARMFSTPSGLARRRARQLVDDSAACTITEIDGERIVVYEWGDPREQPHVLLAHGWSSYALRFQAWIAPLRAAGYAVVGFDQIGHGCSSGQRSNLPQFAHTLAAVASRYDEAAAVVGHSMGGAATAIALTEGLRARRAVLIAPAADLAAALARFTRHVRIPVCMYERVLRAIEQASHVRFEGMLMHLSVPRLSQPALIVHDVDDSDVPWEEGERYARYWPGARLLSTVGLGHNRIANDARVIATTLQFLAGTTVGERVVSTANLPYGLA